MIATVDATLACMSVYAERFPPNRPPDQAAPVEDHVQSVEDMLRHAQTAGTLTDEDLRAIYDARLRMYLSDNTRIWVAAALVLPTSIGSFGVLAALEDPGLGQYLLLAFASTLLVLLWNVFADHHRGFQQRSQAWMRAVERVWGIDDKGPDKAGMRPRILAHRGFNVRRTRWSLVFLVPTFWLLATMFAV